ncbi:glycoside hydrolase family 73 protein [Kosakonia oryziphila]|uniref:Mannosyl-glycoprotein endo-beta-N-acetylglucosaminidase n=1 Tax=Kosakonia oryziphila TaxID=1005667 RepID=A0A1C4F0M8_9ENTR|nr:glucosaminidase domain-containing protein [Kosakonia oryziphila]SCC49440.1 Mannosyl-glycoprotein endo-beta-N-acetylglucosaminidase [Kosakonia oryziphila]
MSKPENGQQLPAIRWPVPKNNRGGEFSNLEEMLAHLEGEATGHWLIGRNGMWHGGIHITDTTTPWCALSGQAMNEAVDFPVPFKGEQAVRCMADGEVVAYRINRDYLSVPWYWGDLRYSGSFVLIRHRVQPGETAESGLIFYTLYMHLAPWLAYPEQDSTAFKVADDQHLNAYVDASRQWVAAELPPGTRVTWDKAVSDDTMTGSNGRQYAHVTLAEPVTGSMSLNAGDRVWTVCDKGNLVPACDSVTRPVWWSPLLPPSRETMQFDTVVCPTPYPIKAGDPVGHLGWFQFPTEDGHEKRYQVHIECLTTDDLPRFLSNPEGVGREIPVFARCPKGIPVYLKVTSGEIQKDLITTQTETVMALSGQAVTDKEGKRYWPGGSSRGLLAESDVQLLSRYDLASRGFEATEDSPVSFDHLDGKTQLKGLVKTIFERFFSVADNGGQPWSKGDAFNYRQLLNQIDDTKSPRYNPEQYRRAVQNPSMRDHLYRLCVKHPSDWYYSSETPVWKTFFTPQLKRDVPEWYAYSMKFLTDIRWMHRVAGMVENPWHLHPLVFLDAINIKLNSKKPIDKEFVKFVFDEARKDELTSHVPAAITTAQAILETGYGKSVPVDIYSGEYSNNLFGIKAHGNPSFVCVNTHEFINGVKKPMVDKFMKYDSYEESVSGRSAFFAKNKRYHFLFDYTDPCDWARGLQRAGYATDPNYADKLIKIMKRENLL